AVLVFPIVLAGLIGAAARFRTGNKWVDLRSAAEAVKQEIFRYRTQTGHYSYRPQARASRDQLLAEQVAAIGRSLMQTDVSRTSLRPPPPLERRAGPSPDDDGMSDLTAERYIELRL